MGTAQEADDSKNGDACPLAEKNLLESPTPTRVWFDQPGQRLAQTNPNLFKQDPTPNTTYILLYDVDPKTELDVDTGAERCYEEPLPPDAIFGDFLRGD